MEEQFEMYAEMAKVSKTKRCNNRNESALYLERLSIPFVSHNYGVHLIIDSENGIIDFWPGTGKWIARSGAAGRGVRNLVTYIKGKDVCMDEVVMKADKQPVSEWPAKPTQGQKPVVIDKTDTSCPWDEVHTRVSR